MTKLRNKLSKRQRMTCRSIFFKDWTLLSRGSYGSVYNVFCPLDNQDYAIKCVKVRTRQHMNRVLHEIRLLASLHHKNIARYYGSWIDHSADNNDDDDDKTSLVLSSPLNVSVFIQMKRYKTDLYTALQDNRPPRPVGISWIHDIADGIVELRRNNIIHPDMCTRNILVDYDDTVVISDFGVVSDPAPSIYRDNKYGYDADLYAFFVMSIEILVKFNTISERHDKLDDPVQFLVENKDDPRVAVVQRVLRECSLCSSLRYLH